MHTNKKASLQSGNNGKAATSGVAPPRGAYWQDPQLSDAAKMVTLQPSATANTEKW
jgi:hypothetical protein